MFPVSAFEVKKGTSTKAGDLVRKDGNFGLAVTLADEELILSLEGNTAGKLLPKTDDFVLVLVKDFDFQIRFEKISSVVKTGKGDHLVYTSAGPGLRGLHSSGASYTFSEKTGQRIAGDLCFDVIAWSGFAASKDGEHLLFTRNYTFSA